MRKFPVLQGLSKISLFLIVGMLVGCTGTSEMTQSEGVSEMASRFQARIGHVDAHPDSLRSVSVSPRGDSVRLGSSFHQIRQTWTVGQRYRDRESELDGPFYSILGGNGAPSNRSVQPRANSSLSREPFATLWSKDLTLASLQEQLGSDTLTTKERRRLIDRKLASYEDTLRIDLYLFTRSTSQGLFEGHLKNARFVLRSGNGQTYPLLRRSFFTDAASVSGRSLPYTRVSLFFDRTEGEGNSFSTASELRLQAINPLGRDEKQGPWYFEWEWETPVLSRKDP